MLGGIGAVLKGLAPLSSVTVAAEGVLKAVQRGVVPRIFASVFNAEVTWGAM